MQENPETPEVNFIGEITVPLDGVEYVLRPSHAAVMASERLTGKSLPEMYREAASYVMTTETMGIICAEMMRAYGRENPSDPLITTYQGAKAERIADLIYEVGGPIVSARLGVLLFGANTGGYTTGGKMKATGNMMAKATPVAD